MGTPTPIEKPTRWATDRRRLARVLSHPLVLLAVGAVVSGLLIPSFSRSSENHKQRLAIKSDLVDSMSNAASPFLAATLANVIAHNGDAPPSYDVAYQQWVTRSNEAFAKLNTYLPDAEATQQWGSFMLRMRDLYYFFRLSPSARGGARDAYTDRLHTYLTSDCRDPATSVHCWQVDFDGISRWLARPNRRFEDSVNFSMEELFFGLRTAMIEIEQATLRASPHV